MICPNRLPRRLFAACTWLAALLGLATAASAYTLLFGKWGNPQRGTAATVTWSYIADGAGINTTNYQDGVLTGTSQIGALRQSIDSRFGSGAFDAAVARAMATWSAAANITFVHVADNGAAFAGTTAIDIRIGSYVFNGASEGGVGYGPPGDAINFPDALAGDIAFAANNNFQIATGPDGTPLPTPGGAYYNDVEGLMLHELGHALGLGHSNVPLGVMCGYIDASSDGSTCRYDLINHQLDPDDIAGMDLLYGPDTPGANGPVPFWVYVALAGVLLWTARSRLAGRQSP